MQHDYRACLTPRSQSRKACRRISSTRDGFFKTKRPAAVDEDVVIELEEVEPDHTRDYLRSQHAAARPGAVEAEQQSPQELTQWAIDCLNQQGGQ